MKTFIFFSASLTFLLLTCSPRNPTIPSGDAPGSLNLTVKLEPIGSLAKRKCIALDFLTITLAAPGEETIVDSIAISGNDRQMITKTFPNIASIKTWTAAVVAKDKTGKTIYSGTTTFTIKPRETVSVSLELAAMYSMLKANFFPIRDSVNACLLLVDGTIVADSAFGRTALRGDTVRLAYDYLTASTKGIQHAIRLDVRGIVWGTDTLLYRGDTVITVVSGQDATYAIKLKCMIKDAPPGIASMTVTLGAKGKVTINGEMQNHDLGDAAEVLTVTAEAHDSIQRWISLCSIGKAREKLVAFLNTQKNVKNIVVADDSTVVSVEFMNGLEAVALFGKPGTISYPGNNEGIAISVSADVNGPEPGGVIDRNGERGDVRNKLSSGTALNMSEWVDFAFTLPNIKTNLTKYGFIHIASHGGIDPQHNGPFFLSGDNAGFNSSDLEGWVETNSDYYHWWKEDSSISPDMVSELWAVKPAFITNLPDTFPKSLVILSYCKSMRNDAMAQAFFGKSAKTVVGWADTPNVDFAREAIDTFITRMVGSAENVSNACRNANTEMRSLHPVIKDSLLFAGAADLQLTFSLTTASDPIGAVKVIRSRNATAYKYGEAVTLTAIPASGYRFSEWSGDVTGSDNPIDLTLMTNTIVTANFIRQYTVSFESQCTNPISPQIVTTGDLISEPTPQINIGFEFSGWFKEPAYINAWNFLTDVVTDNITLYAKCLPVYQINYDGNFNTTGDAPSAMSYTAGDIVTVSLNTGLLTKNGCTFSGWNTDKNGLGTNHQPGSTFSMGSNDIILYANWTVTDIEGNVYHTVTIGTQTWTVENLKTTLYNDGTTIPHVTNETEWSNLNSPGYCWYDNDESTYKNTYGALYNWFTVNTGKLAPTGWHVPTDGEWQVLVDYLGYKDNEGGKLKEVGTSHWNDPNIGADNSTGFTALPGGWRGDNGGFYHIGSTGIWWTSTEDHVGTWYWWLENNSRVSFRYSNTKQGGLSIRCVVNSNE